MVLFSNCVRIRNPSPMQKAADTDLPYPTLLACDGADASLPGAPAKVKMPPLLPFVATRGIDTPTSSSSGTPSTGTATIRRQRMILEHDDNAQQLGDLYDVEQELLGVGAFGTVRRARLRSAPSVMRAVKSVRKRSLKTEHAVRQEISVLKRLDHPCICRLLETFEDEDAIYLVLELVEGKELFHVIADEGHLDERRAAIVMKQALAALAYCHEHGVMHRDLKPENIMLVQQDFDAVDADVWHKGMEVKLIDFGLAVFDANPGRMRAGSCAAGTPEYLAPEARRGKYLPASDVWSMGVILHVLLLGVLPEEEVLLGEEELQMDTAMYSAVSADAKDLMLNLLRPQPSQRLAAAAALAHPWIGGETDLQARRSRLATRTKDRLKSFHRSAQLRRAAKTAVGMHLTGKQLQELREQFLLIDTDGNGRISKEELARCMTSASLARGDADSTATDVQSWVDEIFEAIDTDGSQEIEYTEWLAAAAGESAILSDQAALAAFRCFDLDGDGLIDAEELASVLSKTPEEIAILLPQFDVDGDGAIDFTEFRSMLSGTTSI